MKRGSSFLGACLSAALLTACGGSGLSSPAPASVTPQTVGRNAQMEQVLYSFAGSPDGESPYTGRLTDVGGTLYGTTTFGGANGVGTIFSMTTSGAESVVYSFTGSPDGSNPNGNLVSVRNALYGTTTSGGANNAGTVTTSGTETVLYSFKGGRTDGNNPSSSGLTNVGATLYGTTDEGGESDKGVIYVFVKPAGPEYVLHSFRGKPDGADPEAGLTNIGDKLYGTTYRGGANDKGTVYSLSF